MSDGFLDHQRDLNQAELMHIKALEASAEQLFNVLKGNRPDPDCMREAIKKLEECVMWGRKGIVKGIKL